MTVSVRPRPGGGFLLQTSQLLPGRPDDVFPFFADAANLERITPPWLRFRILTELPLAMRAGALIDYRLRLHGVPIRWRTEITVWEPPHRFVDEQVRGPYRWWVHEHRFTEADGGTLATDSVDYGVRGGRLANGLVVRRDLERIFAYRRARLSDAFALPAGRDET